ncbi:MAG TPA: Ig-like domain-containing protein [Solirubrobacteraceae bacterium]|nr:Ig-like domain-containing protein [Solirubrobacteraceae bacterium]
MNVQQWPGMPRSGGVRPAHRGKRIPALIQAAAALAVLAAIGGPLALNAGAAPSDTTAKQIPGNPMTVYIGPRGQCQSSYTVGGVVEGNYFPGGAPYDFSPVADCGFFLSFPKAGTGQPVALQGKTFGFAGNAAAVDFSEIYTPVSQSPVSGDGSTGDPFTQTTVFEVIDSAKVKDALITETTTYVNGAPQFTSTYNVKNVTADQLYFRAIYAGDLFVNGSDLGTGLIGGPPRFIGGQNTSTGVLGGLQEASSPALAWSAFEELPYPTIWDRIQSSVEEAHTFKEEADPEEVDNAVGVEWDQLRNTGLAPGTEQAFQIINRTQIPTLGVQPATQTHTVGQTASVTVTAADNAGTPYGSRPIVYKIDGANPKSGSVTTDASGQATISYVGTGAGIDTMQMFLDLNGNGSPDNSEPSGTAQVTWTPPPPTPPAPNSGYKIQSIKANADGTITIVFVPTQDGTATVEVTVPTATISRNASIARAKKCKRGLVRIKGKCRPKTSVSGKVSSAGKAGVPLKVTVKPSSKVKKALAKGKKVQLTAKLTYKSVLGGAPTVKVYHFTVKPKKKKKKHR